MKLLTILGVLLILAGLAGLVVGSIPFTSDQTIVEIGPLSARAEQQRHLVIPAYAGFAAIAAGALLVVMGQRRR